MQAIKVEHIDTSYKGSITPEKRAQNREKLLLTYVIKATARDQEKNITISKLQREMSATLEDLDALKAEVNLKDKFLHSMEEELSMVKAENEALKQQMQLLMLTSNNNNNNRIIGSPASISPNPGISRKRSIKKSKDAVKDVANFCYNLRKKSKK